MTRAAALMRLSEAIASALEADDPDAADGLLDRRARLLGVVTAEELSADERVALVESAPAVAEADRRALAALTQSLRRAEQELTELATGVSALYAYAPHESLAPGFIDRRD
jgi:hypothetical protein